MKIKLLLIGLICSFISHSQDTDPRSLKMGVYFGRSQAQIAKSYTLNGNTGATVPLFQTMLNEFGVAATLGSKRFPQLSYRLDLGYNSLQTSFTNIIDQFVNGYSMPVAYIKPGIGFSLPLDERWKVVPSINAAFNTNLDQNQAFIEDKVRYVTEGNFLTLNPAIEIQMNADGPWYLSAYAEYQLGFAPVVTSYYPNSTGEGNSKIGVYEGSAMNIGLKLQYCLPCAE